MLFFNLFFRVMIFCATCSLAADGCGSTVFGDGGYSVRCGDECTGGEGFCTCGEGAKKFNHRDNTTWCCNASQCEKNGKDIVCKMGTLLPLSTPCQGKCNTGRSFNAGRQYWTCDSREQCIKIQHWQDKTHHCKDRSDERKRQEDVFSPVQWDLLTTCYVLGNTHLPGVMCSGQGHPGDCMDYSRWCNDKSVMKCGELGGRTSVHTEVCSNNTFWTGKTCRGWRKDGRRCSSGYSGQCFYPESHGSSFLLKTCKDGSHDILPLLPWSDSCPPTFFSCLVNNRNSCLSPYLHCDLHPQCDDGADEKNCKYVYKMKGLTKPSGTRTCHHLHYGPGNKINKSEVEILALSCDGGLPECAGGVDEMCDPLLDRFGLCKSFINMLVPLLNSLYFQTLCLLLSPSYPCFHRSSSWCCKGTGGPEGLIH